MGILQKIIAFIILPVSVFGQDPLPPVGMWRDHLPYKSAIDVTAGDGKIFCATPFSLFSVNTNDNVIERFSKISGLNETGIRTIKFDESNDKLFITYDNSNIDILYRNDIYNIPDLKRDNISGDKSIYNVYPLGKNYFLSSGLGIIIINGEKYEVKDSWFIGNAGGKVKVTGFTSDGTYYYAATEEGLKRTALTVSNPADYSNWQLLSGNNGLPAGACKNIMTVQGKIIAEQNNSLYIQNGSNWTLFYSDNRTFISSNTTEGKIQLCEQSSNGTSRVVILNADGTVNRVLEHSAISKPLKAIQLNNNTWIADGKNSLSRFGSSADFENYSLNSPQGIANGEMVVYNNIFYGTAGSVNSNWGNQNNADGIFRLENGLWTNTNSIKNPVLDSLKDFITIAIDKRDETIWAGSYGGGLLHVKQGQVFEIFKQNYLGAAVNDPVSFRVSGLAFDNDNNLWVSNFGALQQLKVRKNDGTWRSFLLPFSVTQNAVSQLVIDDNNYKWIIAPLGNGLICFDHGNSIDNTNDDKWKKLSTGTGNGNLPVNDVRCIAKDKSGYIWVGTADGIAVIQCPELIFSVPVCDAIWPIVPIGNFAGYLFKGQDVRSIAVDGADRKWVATAKGVFLINATGEKVIYQFTEDNSPLLSNDVTKIAIDGKTGEVYFATQKGICSFRSTSTDGGESNENVLVFPNPVPPGYAGTIAVRGLVNNAIVKITELDGRLVYQSRALGGQAVWDGRNYRGQKISSGVYLVLVSDDGRKERMATKIFFISK